MSFEGNLAYIPTEEEIETAWWLFFVSNTTHGQ
ncbi:hypothetical protein PIIN_11476 [Serendipita indica DSM 11827]|uniref:Uncharacterized protein n=1 Tax=Serendipita indica (strain DSM 11827) TaxID=1109443 RepID=G4U1Q6_SERID|nr:hypothetical protein PIIN_11476 [Serendipita indica DSM 11827]